VCQHPWFEVAKLGASERSSGERYGKIVNWQQGASVPAGAAEEIVASCDPKHFANCDLVFSALVRLDRLRDQ
jgi:aspartate-semialdehyde dehydrogenase